MKIQIIGQVSGLPRAAVEKKFQIAEDKLTADGFEVWNPVKEVPASAEYADAMRICLRNLCDPETKAVAVQRDWHESKGAVTEYLVAQSLNLEFIHLLWI